MQRTLPAKIYVNEKMDDPCVIFVGVIYALFFHGNIKKAWAFSEQVGVRISYSRLIRRLHDNQELILEIQKIISALFQSDIVIIDSMGIKVCEKGRIIRNRKVQGKRLIGFLHTEGEYFLGAKIHLIVSSDGIPLSYDVLPASFHDII